MRLALAGLLIGLLGAFGLGKVLSGLVANVVPFDIATAAIVGAVLAAVALLASYFPARFATRVDPVIALRGD
jgi:ABC-type antimicrobial peptide transport system permease subunit